MELFWSFVQRCRFSVFRKKNSEELDSSSRWIFFTRPLFFPCSSLHLYIHIVTVTMFCTFRVFKGISFTYGIFRRWNWLLKNVELVKPLFWTSTKYLYLIYNVKCFTFSSGVLFIGIFIRWNSKFKTRKTFLLDFSEICLTVTIECNSLLRIVKSQIYFEVIEPFYLVVKRREKENVKLFNSFYIGKLNTYDSLQFFF